ncbi:hypothetical protein A2165_01545 [Candidatus Curtissbacteria bacterium RBG_13_40_7]|uniref:N-acetyltransferase domain-containing protein n=1 Tax=Candidatus Curtissbacteria bacterium RBG_13_40_7 TaxID=1797706 RepID=A0A1F5FTV4_9BACT|nr:MAG: hypothetical protein A2165_01545 [Candidatus Curtissbacteria bacterium RBG_13_40_7]
MSKERIKVIRRQARLSDVDAIFKLDQEVWTEFPGTKDMFMSRIMTFPEGQIVAVYNGKVIGYLGLEFLEFDIHNPHTFTWDEVSDKGMIKKSHSYSGQFMYGIAMTVSNEFQGCGVGTQLVLSGWGMMVGFNRRGSLIGSRVPSFHKYSDKMSIEDYVKLKDEKGMFVDPELRLWSKDGFYPVLILPNYCNDPDSLNYGVVVYRANPFYGWPGRSIIAYFLSEIGPKVIRSNF